MMIKVSRSNRIEDFNGLITDVLQHKEINGLIIFTCDKNDYDSDRLNDLLKNIPVPIFGGIFPGIVYEKERLIKGAIVIGLQQKPNIHIIPHLSDVNEDYVKLINGKIPESGKNKTMFIFVDSLSKRIGSLIDSVIDVFGLDYNYIGGGAGTGTSEKKPCLITNYGLIQDSAIIALVDVHSGIGISRGWKTVGGPYKVTDSDQNMVKSLNWISAFKVYRDVIRIYSGKDITATNFQDIAKSYPLGIKRFGNEKIIREPLKVEKDGVIVCAGDIPKNSYVDILNGKASLLVDAAEDALKISMDSIPAASKNTITIIMESFSRALFLDDYFVNELTAVTYENSPLIGALTMGEIANSGKNYLEFFNKTSVVGVLEA